MKTHSGEDSSNLVLVALLSVDQWITFAWAKPPKNKLQELENSPEWAYKDWKGYLKE